VNVTRVIDLRDVVPPKGKGAAVVVLDEDLVGGAADDVALDVGATQATDGRRRGAPRSERHEQHGS
jgi:hypothetical protein